uniref:Fibronectin type-III domain-containing protein n=1 Tax=Callorhinchus milii TaxID=7868 RepID=A0A4W3JIC7_CALMI
MNICSYVDHSCQCKPHYKLNSKTFNMDSCVYITPAAWSSPQSAYKNVTRDSSNGEPSEYITHERQCSPLRVSTANVDVGGCSHMTRSSQYNPPCVTEVDVASDPSNVYPYTYVTRSSQYSPQCMLVDVASNTTNVNTFGSVINSDQDNPPASLSKINAASNTSNLDSCLCVSQSSQYNLLCISKVEPASNTSNVNTLGSVINSNQYIGQCTSKMDAASNTPYMSSCGSALNSKLCNPHYNFEIQTVSSDCKKHSHPYQKCNIPKMCSSKPEKHISLNCSECICFQTHKPKNSHNWNTKLRTASETVPCHQAPSTPSECGCNGNVQESNACRGTSKATKSRQVPGIPQLVPTSQYHSQCHSKGNTSSGASGVDFSPKRPQSSSNIPSSKTEKCASECHDTVDLFTNKACTLSHTRQDSDTGIILDSKSSSLASVGEYGERIPGPYPLHCPDSIQSNNKHSIPCGLHDPCCYQHGDHPQCASSNSGACHIDSVKDKPCQFSNLTCLNTVKNISSSCFHTANFLNNPTSNNASSTNLRPHCTAANNPCCESPSLLPERDCCGNTAVSGQCHQKCSSDEPCIDPNKKETSCLPKKTFSTATDASFAYFDSAGNAKPWSLRNAPDGFCDTNAKHKTMEGSCLRKPRLFPKSKHQCNPKPPTAFMPKFAHSNPPQVQPVDQSKVNSDTSSSDSIKNKNYQLTKTPSSDSVKSNSSTRFDNIVFPQKWPFRTGHKISSLKPRSGIRIRAGHKPSVFTSKKNRGSRSFPSLSELRNLKLTCSIGKLQLFDSHIHFDEDIDPAQISSQTISTESTSTFEHELPEAPFIFKHTVDGTSAKVRWTFPMEEQSVNFFELQFQEIVSIDREMAIPQDQAGVFSGIRHNNFTATNLNSNSEYLFRVRAVNAAGKGEWSQPYKIVTVGGTEQCDPDTEDSASLKGVKVTIRRSSKNSLED